MCCPAPVMPTLHAPGAPMSGVLFATLANPVSGADGAVAFTGTLSGTGVNTTNNSGLFFAADGTTAKLLARTGELALGGGHWKSFTTMALPEDDPARGPIFLQLAPESLQSAQSWGNVSCSQTRARWPACKKENDQATSLPLALDRSPWA